VSLKNWLARLERAHPTPIELGLERVSRVRDAMGLAPPFLVILVGGTNGKGSTCAYLESILHEQGYRTGLYTSPHLLRYNERVRIDGRAAGDDFIVNGLQAVEAARDDISLTYFEHATLGAMWQFIQSAADVAILEVGLGGRLDATNIFEPAASVVTSVDLDHQAWLGDNREAIGFEKACIYRAGKPAICGVADPPRTLVNYAQSIGASLLRAGRDYTLEQHATDWDFIFAETALAGLPLPALPGSHQVNNAASALATLAALANQLPVSLAAIHQGLVKVRLPGRFQRFHPGYAGDRAEVVLDVAHNPESARALAGNLRAFPVQGKTHAVFALLADKDADGIIGALNPCVDTWFVAGLSGERGQSGEVLAAKVKTQTAKPVNTFVDPIAAFQAAKRHAAEGDRIIAFGSFYTVAEILQTLP
jgi:dihydrofolate synthase / folylpolyglutamate synthase